jgi:hypothetical protein
MMEHDSENSATRRENGARRRARMPGTAGRLALLAMLLVASTAQALCPITEHGAKPDGSVVTASIQAAIDACASAGGGRVLVPSGTFVTGTLYLKSGIDLHLERGAVLRGSGSFADYPFVDRRLDDHNKSIAKSGLTDPERLAIVEAEGQRALIYARNVSDVSITGLGTIDGNGEAFWDPGFLTSGMGRPTLPRPRPWIWFRDARQVTVKDITLIDSPSYFLSFETSDDVAVDGIRIRAHPLSPNSDGIQIEGGRDVRIRGVSIRTGDDAIVLKSSNADIAHVTISDSYLESDDSAFKFGTGSTHAIRHVRIVNTQIANSRIGIALFMKDGGRFEFLDADGLNIATASRHRTDYPIYVDLDRRFPDSALGHIRHIRIANTRIESRGNILIGGHPDRPIEDLTLDGIRFVVRDPVDLTALGGKPRGNMMLAGQTPGADFATRNAHVTAGWVDRLVLRDVVVSGDPSHLGSRSVLHVAHIDQVAISGLRVGPGSRRRVVIDGGEVAHLRAADIELGDDWPALQGFRAERSNELRDVDLAGAAELQRQAP